MPSLIPLLFLLPLADVPATPPLWTLTFPDRVERFEVKTATYSVYEDDGQAALTVRVDAGALVSPLPAREGMTTPFWELTAILPEGQSFALEPGQAWSIPAGFDDDRDEYVVDFYYYEHEVSDDNRIEVVAVDGQRLRLRITGTAWSYDGRTRKPKAVPLSVEAEFTFDKHTTRSSS